MPTSLTDPHPVIDGRSSSSKSTLYHGALEGHVLVKNTNGALPLKRPKMMSVFGYSAKSADWNNIDNWLVGTQPYVGGQSSSDIMAYAFNGTMYSAGGSGANSQTLLSSPMNALTNQCFEDDTQMLWDFTSNEPTVAAASDVCLVFIK